MDARPGGRCFRSLRVVECTFASGSPATGGSTYGSPSAGGRKDLNWDLEEVTGLVGYLDVQGLAQLLRKLLPNLTEGEVYYFQVMLDVDGDGRIEHDEFMSTFMSTVQLSLAAEQDGRGSQESKTTLDRFRRYLQDNANTSQQHFDAADRERRGYLRFPELALPHTGALQAATTSPSAYSYPSNFNTKTAKTPAHGSSTGGYNTPSASPSAYSSPSNYNTLNSTSAFTNGWNVREMFVDGTAYLLDSNTNKVYTSTESGWPELVGSWDGRQVRHLKKSAASRFFQRLDQYLKENKVRFRDLFDSFDARRKGFLDVTELESLVTRLMPDVGRGDLKYFQVMVDENQDGK
eukprot:gene29766-5414_t